MPWSAVSASWALTLLPPPWMRTSPARPSARWKKSYRRAIAALFQGEDYITMFKRREIYRHLSNAADRMANCANTLHDIVVKIT